MEADFQINIDGLKKLIKDLKKPREIHVGVLDDERSAKIGLKHEFGDSWAKLPMRSFLTMPIHKKQYQLQDVAQATLEETGDIKEVYKETAIMAKSIVDDAFETGGFGEWEKLSDMTIGKKINTKNATKVLIETGQLRRSIKAKVVNL
jgi:hypothetical protein